MLEPKEWDMVLRPLVPTHHAKKVIGEHARALLTDLLPGEILTTNQVVEALYPRDVADKSLTGDVARTRMYQLLAALAVDGLHDCATRGEPTAKKYMGRPTRPWLWHAPKVKESCPMCGQHMPEATA
jgi:hypothetical protein